jgi:hypothetical protein
MRNSSWILVVFGIILVINVSACPAADQRVLEPNNKLQW